MAIYDYIPIEPTGMYEWTLFVFGIIGMATMVSIKLFDKWKIEHDINMHEQIQRIDEHERRLNDASTDMAVIKSDLTYVKQSLDGLKTPLENMIELTQKVFEKVLDNK